MKKNFLLKLLCLFIAVVMSVGLFGCNEKPSGPSDPSGSDGEAYYTVTFDVQGHGTAPVAQQVKDGGHAQEPTAPVAEGWTFGGWFKEAGCENAYVFATETVTGNVTVYAKWTEKSGGQTPVLPEQPSTDLPTDKTPTIYLAGDSTVQGYSDSQYIAGWGQYLDLFLKDDVKVVNYGKGGRSTRSFINEGRLTKNTDPDRKGFSENGGKSIEENIKAGDFLFIQFGHNDDASKQNDSALSYMADRMVPLGTADASGKYPVTAPNETSGTENGKRSKDYLPPEYEKATQSVKTKMLDEIKKYGKEYYAYGDGTFKWYLKQYVDFAREKGAIPVLCTPVARVSFNADGTLKSGPGLHGEDFAYVKAVRQLAEEENCLLIDNFAYTKETLEKATKDFSDFLMAIVPNEINNGPWPTGYDNAYKNSSAGYDKTEGTHYNKYGAYLTAAYVAESVIEGVKTVKGSEDVKEYFNFASNVLTTPSAYVQPSNRISISKVAELEKMFDKVNPTDPNRTYVQPSVAIEAIENLVTKGTIESITTENYETWKGYCEQARAVYESLNFDLRKDVTNLNVLEEYEAKVASARPKPIKSVVLSTGTEGLTCGAMTSNNRYPITNSSLTVEDHTFVFGSDVEKRTKSSSAVTFNNVVYPKITESIYFSGNAKLTTASPVKYIEFQTTGKCEVTIIASGGGDTTDVVLRYIQMVDASKKPVCEFAFGPTQSVETNTVEKAGTYRIGSKGSGIDVYYIIIEYYA